MKTMLVMSGIGFLGVVGLAAFCIWQGASWLWVAGVGLLWLIGGYESKGSK